MTGVSHEELTQVLLGGMGQAVLLRDYAFGIHPGGIDVCEPVYPYHRAPRKCPFCGRVYRRHGGFADHRNRCEDGPNPGSNPDAGGEST